MIPLDLYAGTDYPYRCQFDFVDATTNLELNQRSDYFYISDTANSPPRIWSQGNVSREIQLASAASSSPTASSTSTTSPTGAQGSSSSTNARPPTPSADHRSGTGIGAGGIAGIVIAALVGGGLITGFAVFFWLRRRQRSSPAWQNQVHQAPLSANEMSHGFYGVAEKEGDDGIPEIGGSPLTELDARRGDSRLKSP